MKHNKFCIYQRDIINKDDDRFGCMHTESNNNMSSYVCPFLTETHAEYICHYYTKKNITNNIEERLTKLEQAMKCLKVILKE